VREGEATKKWRYTEEQAAYALRLAESGTPAAKVCRQAGIAEATFYLWKE
jgi:putative transposase